MENDQEPIKLSSQEAEILRDLRSLNPRGREIALGAVKVLTNHYSRPLRPSLRLVRSDS